ncbi:hypothetical protein BDR05DRAFT_959884 [Suillus weaverae]|nr:hypothetical protein BDR05DRAFT_959884 [Suillus weaverae]
MCRSSPAGVERQPPGSRSQFTQLHKFRVSFYRHTSPSDYLLFLMQSHQLVLRSNAMIEQFYWALDHTPELKLLCTLFQTPSPQHTPKLNSLLVLQTIMAGSGHDREASLLPPSG